MTDPLVSTAWLAERLDDPAVQIVDATWYMPDEKRPGRPDYEAGHIPGAVFFDLDGLSDHSTGLPHMLLSPDAFAKAAGELGLRRDATVVVYDGAGIFSAPRVWWNLRIMGFTDVHVLDGGLKAWRAEGRPEVAGPQALPPTTLAPAFKPEMVRDLDGVRDTLTLGLAQVVDARAAGRFSGAVPEPRAGLRAGHMPGARNVPWGGLLNPDGTMKPAADLKAAFEAGGVDTAHPIVTTCGSGVSAAILSLALARIGAADAPIYDGSWTEWGGRADVPIATGA